MKCPAAPESRMCSCHLRLSSQVCNLYCESLWFPDERILCLRQVLAECQQDVDSALAKLWSVSPAHVWDMLKITRARKIESSNVLGTLCFDRESMGEDDLRSTNKDVSSEVGPRVVLGVLLCWFIFRARAGLAELVTHSVSHELCAELKYC